MFAQTLRAGEHKDNSVLPQLQTACVKLRQRNKYKQLEVIMRSLAAMVIKGIICTGSFEKKKKKICGLSMIKPHLKC